MTSGIEPRLGDYTVVFNHYAQIPMKDGRIITDAPSLVCTGDGALLCAVPIIIKGTAEQCVPELHFFLSRDDGRT